MGEAQQERPCEVTSRRRVLTNIRAIVGLAAVAVTVNLVKLAPARAGDDDHGGHGGHGGPPCFLRGTKIRTVEGKCRVEDLAVGDLLPTAFAGIRPVQWVGSWRCGKNDPDERWSARIRPVRIIRSALAPDVPHADLYVTQGHALLVDGVLVPAGSLVNGTTIVLDPADEFDELEYFHIKLATHDVIYAEGAPAETLLNVPKTATNHTGHLGTKGRVEAQVGYCAPVLCNGARKEISSRVRSVISPWLGPQKIDLIRARLADRAMALC